MRYARTLRSMLSSIGGFATRSKLNSGAEAPILWLGLAGFSVEQRIALLPMLRRLPDLPRWELHSFRAADAWLLNGARCRVRPDGTLVVLPAASTDKHVRLDVSDMDRPLAFANPLPDELEARCTFDLSSPASVQGMLLQLDVGLQLERAQFELGAQLVRLGAALRHGVFHVVHRDKLLAVLDLRKGQVGLSPALHAAHVQNAEWHRRPSGAAEIPPSFIASSPAQLACTYARRSERDLLPQRYRERTIYFRRRPRIPMRLLDDTHLLVLRELSASAATLGTLVQRTGLKYAQLERVLACLYYAGSITTTRTKAARSLLSDPAAVDIGDSSNPASLLTEQEPVLSRPELTAPAVLRRDVLEAH